MLTLDRFLPFWLVKKGDWFDERWMIEVVIYEGRIRSRE